MKLLIIILLLFPRLLLAQEPAIVTLNEEQLERFKVVEVKLMERTLFACANGVERLFDADDFNRDGVLDDYCIGVQYDPCDIHTLQIAIIRQAMSGGNGCESLDDIERRRRRQEACDSGFSPQPDFCT